MPTTRRITRTARLEGLTSDQKYHLLKGFTLLSFPDPYFGRMSYPFQDEDHRRQLWEQHKAELMKEVGKNYRPAGWWDYDNKFGRRRILSGDPSMCLWEKGERFGTPRLYNIENLDQIPVFETQRQFLKRHNLMEEK